jgi:ribonuclease III
MTDLRAYLRETFGHDPSDLALFERALTHGSMGKDSYERLEFVGDRVVGLAIARWLYERFRNEPEGKLSRRYNVLVSRETCAEIGREIGLPAWIRLGKQARDDRANQSDNVIGDVVEALVGALLIDGGLEKAEAFVRRAWASFVESQGRAPKHPKSALQELAAAKDWATPEYELERKSGAHHAPRFTVRVSIKGVGDTTAEGSSKQEAETAAAAALLERLQ